MINYTQNRAFLNLAYLMKLANDLIKSKYNENSILLQKH